MMYGSLMTTQVSNTECDCTKFGPNYFLARTMTYTYSMYGGGWITKVFYEQTKPDSKLCCEGVNLQYESHAYTNPYQVATLEKIAAGNLLYWLQRVGRHDIPTCKIKSAVIRVLLALTYLELPEHFKISRIVRNLTFDSFGRKPIKQHVCFPGFVMACREAQGCSTSSFHDLRDDEEIEEIDNLSVRIRYVSVRFYDKVIFPRFPHASVPMTMAFPHENNAVDTISFGTELHPPVIHITNLVPLYEYLKKNRSYKCCEAHSQHAAQIEASDSYKQYQAETAESSM